MKLQEFFVFSLFERRGANLIWKTFGINRFELWMLFNFCSACLVMSRRTASKAQVMNFITGNPNTKRRFGGYWAGCLIKGLLLEVALNNGKSTFILSDKGAKVLDLFEHEVTRLEKQAKAQQSAIKKPIKYKLSDLRGQDPSTFGHPYVGIRPNQQASR